MRRLRGSGSAVTLFTGVKRVSPRLGWTCDGGFDHGDFAISITDEVSEMASDSMQFRVLTMTIVLMKDTTKRARSGGRLYYTELRVQYTAKTLRGAQPWGLLQVVLRLGILEFLSPASHCFGASFCILVLCVFFLSFDFCHWNKNS